MRAISIAAIVSGLIATPASAATITASFGLTLSPIDVPNDMNSPSTTGALGSQFPLFNQETGVLGEVTATLNGALEATSIAKKPQVDFFLYNSQIVGGRPFEGLIFQLPGDSFPQFAPTSLSVAFSAAVSPSDQGDFLGAGNAQILFAVGSPDPAGSTVIGSEGPLTGTITYTYTLPTLTLSIPEPSTWGMMLIGFAGLAFMGRSARGGFLNRTRLADAC